MSELYWDFITLLSEYLFSKTMTKTHASKHVEEKEPMDITGRMQNNPASVGNIMNVTQRPENRTTALSS